MKQPYENFKEWEQDMDRIRAYPQDVQLIQHVRGRVTASAPEIQEQVNEYLMDMQFAQNPMAAGQFLAKRFHKVFVIRHPQDPWFYV